MESMDVEEGQRPRVDTGEMESWKKSLLIVLGIGLVVMTIVLPLSFKGVEYYEVSIESNVIQAYILHKMQRMWFI